MDLFNFLIILIVFSLDVALVYMNYVARIKLGAFEMNPIWRRFDTMKGKMKFMSFFLTFLLINVVIIALLSYAPRNIYEERAIYLTSGALLGFLFFNFCADYLTLQDIRKKQKKRAL